MHRKLTVFVLLLTIAMIWGCATVKEFGKLVKKPDVSLKGVSFKNVSLFEATPVFKFEVTNPNPVGATIKRITYDFLINDEPFIYDTLEQGITIKSGGSGIVELPVTFNYFDLFDSVAELIKADTVAYDLSGSIRIGLFDIPYHTEGNYRVPKLPKVSLKKVDISDLSFTKASVVFHIDLKNSNPFTVKLDGLNYGLKLGGKQFVKGKTETVSTIGRNGVSTLKIPMNISFMKLGSSVYNLMTKSSSGYELSGSMKFDLPELGIKTIPFKKTGEVPFNFQ
ncbi:MAG: LEA type 2 family protein [Desulfobacteraceae bacterium]|nr:LEA type 2 family protein [Desulfobacteraceae bacterium]